MIIYMYIYEFYDKLSIRVIQRTWVQPIYAIGELHVTAKISSMGCQWPAPQSGFSRHLNTLQLRRILCTHVNMVMGVPKYNQNTMLIQLSQKIPNSTS